MLSLLNNMVSGLILHSSNSQEDQACFFCIPTSNFQQLYGGKKDFTNNESFFVRLCKLLVLCFSYFKITECIGLGVVPLLFP